MSQRLRNQECTVRRICVSSRKYCFLFILLLLSCLFPSSLPSLHNELGVLEGMNLRQGEDLGIALEGDVISSINRRWVPESTGPSVTTPADRASIIRAKNWKKMVLVPAGRFEMGSTDREVDAAYQLGKKDNPDATKRWFNDEKPRHQVWVDAFYMDKYEVTVGEYKAFTRATGFQGLPDFVSEYAPGGNHPVVGVSWDDAGAYCRWAGKQLPTEAQWEKAARGSDRRSYPWGNKPINGKLANYCDINCEFPWKDKNENDRYKHTSPVGYYELGENPNGIHDLAGNVWEWVQDWYDRKYYSRSSKNNPVNRKKALYRLVRGGGWDHAPALIRSAYRYGLSPDSRGYLAVGFRCVVGVS